MNWIGPAVGCYRARLQAAYTRATVDQFETAEVGLNRGPLLFLASFFALASSWFGYVLIPQAQLGRMQPTNTVPAGITYPLARPGLARQGLEVYRANGCAACHSQQVGQTATVCDVLLTELGKRQPRWQK